MDLRIWLRKTRLVSKEFEAIIKPLVYKEVGLESESWKAKRLLECATKDMEQIRANIRQYTKELWLNHNKSKIEDGDPYWVKYAGLVESCLVLDKLEYDATPPLTWLLLTRE